MTQTNWQQEQELFYSTATFRLLLDSLARPGKINRLAYPTFWDGAPNFNSSPKTLVINMHALASLATLLDGEVSYVMAADGQWLDQHNPAVQWVTVRTGSPLAKTPNKADFAFFCDGSSKGLLSVLNPGNLLEPEISTTAFYCVEHLSQADQHTLPLTLQLSGPGIEGSTSIGIAGLEQNEINIIQATRQSYPLGIDIFLIDSLGQCVGLPRTTRLFSNSQG